MPWIQLKLNTTGANAEELSDALMEAGSVSITFQDTHDTPVFEPLPGETRLWGDTDVIGLFDAETDMKEVVAILEQHPLLGAGFAHKIEQLEDKDWEREWMDNFHPMRFGERLWICPSWRDVPDENAVNVMLDPGLAFGTGTHPTIEGFEKLEIMRNAYAIEYDCIDPTQLAPTLEFKGVPGLFGAGQFNGTSGYEEAAAQGLVAGINAAQEVQGKEPLVLDRSTSYIGTLIDDLVIKGVTDPYRMMTSRSEYRLILRQDNADQRLTPIGYRLGLCSQARYDALMEKKRAIDAELARLEGTTVSPTEELNALLQKLGTAPLRSGTKLADLLRRPQVGYDALAGVDGRRPPLPRPVTEQVEISLKYEGYIRRQLEQVEQMQKLERRRLPVEMDYAAIGGLRLEAREKLAAVRPQNLGQASRISGVSPADISVLLIWLSQQGGKEEKDRGEKGER